MEWIIVASDVVELLIWFVTKSGEGFVQKVGEEVFDFLKTKFKNDKEATTTLSNFSRNPSRCKRVLIDIIKEKVVTDHEFGKDLSSLYEKNQELMIGGSRIVQNALGDGIAQAVGTCASASVILGKPESAVSYKKKK
jgi:hypothetical protein